MKKKEFEFLDNLSEEALKRYARNCFYLFLNPNFSYDMEYMINDKIYSNSLIRYLKDIYRKNYASQLEKDYYSDVISNRFKNSNKFLKMKAFFNKIIDSKEIDSIIRKYADENNITKAEARNHLSYYYLNFASLEEKEKYDLLFGINKEKYDLRKRMLLAYNMVFKPEVTEEEINNLANKFNTSVNQIFKYCESYVLIERKDLMDKYFKILKAINEKKETFEDCIIESKYKYAFDICMNTKFDEEKISKFRISLGIPKNSAFINFAKLYADNYATPEEKKIFYDMYDKRKANEKIFNDLNIEKEISYKEIFNVLLSIENFNDQKKYLDKFSSIEINELKNKIDDYLNNNKINNTEIENKLRIIFDEYLFKKLSDNQLNREKNIKEKNDEDLNKGKKLIKLYVKSNCLTIDEYCEKNNFSKNEFNYLIDCVKKFDEETYNIFDEYKKSRTYLETQIFETQINKIIKEIKDNKIFNILDYYKILNLNPEKFLKLAKTVLEKKDYLILVKFFDKNYNTQMIDMNTEINSVTKIKNVIIDKDDKKEVIRFMIKNDYPLYKNLYDLILLEKTNESKS